MVRREAPASRLSGVLRPPEVSRPRQRLFRPLALPNRLLHDLGAGARHASVLHPGCRVLHPPQPRFEGGPAVHPGEGEGATAAEEEAGAGGKGRLPGEPRDVPEEVSHHAQAQEPEEKGMTATYAPQGATRRRGGPHPGVHVKKGKQVGAAYR